MCGIDHPAKPIAFVVALLRPAATAFICMPLAAWFTVKPVKVAMPPTACTVSFPVRAVPAEVLASATVIAPLYVVLRLPKLSSAQTTNPNALPALILPGGWVCTTSWVADPATTVKPFVVADVKPVAVAVRVYPGSATVSVNPVKVATPRTALTVSFPPSVLPPGLFARASVTLPVNVGTTFPSASSAWTTRPSVRRRPHCWPAC